MTPKKLVLAAIALAVILLLAIAFLLRNRDSRDWGEITIISVTGGENGFGMKLETSHVNGGGISDTYYINGERVGGGHSQGSGFLLFPPSKASVSFYFGVDSEGTNHFTDTPQFRAMQALTGKTFRIYAGEEFSLYDFTYAGKHHQRIYKVIPRD